MKEGGEKIEGSGKKLFLFNANDDEESFFEMH